MGWYFVESTADFLFNNFLKNNEARLKEEFIWGWRSIINWDPKFRFDFLPPNSQLLLSLVLILPWSKILFKIPQPTILFEFCNVASIFVWLYLFKFIYDLNDLDFFLKKNLYKRITLYTEELHFLLLLVVEGCFSFWGRTRFLCLNLEELPCNSLFYDLTLLWSQSSYIFYVVKLVLYFEMFNNIYVF